MLLENLKNNFLTMASSKVAVVLLIAALILLFQFGRVTYVVEEKTQFTNPLDGCRHVYLDMGTNTGIQIRKLYEPSLFPNALVFPTFDKYFGPPGTSDRQSTCSVGWEPNPEFTQDLTKLEDSYNKCGWKVLIHKELGVDSKNSVARFSRIDGQAAALAGRFIDDNEVFGDAVEIKSMWLAEFIKEVVAKRKRPDHLKGNVLMKLDVEGKELDIMPDLIVSGAIQYIDGIYVEYHPQMGEDIVKLSESMDFLNRIVKEKQLDHSLEIITLDDESYYTWKGDFPEC